MPVKQVPQHGNLSSYKVYVRPAANRAFGYHARTTKHQDNVNELLRTLFTQGTSTTWDLAKANCRKAPLIRKQDKMYRRLLVGREDRGRRSPGIMDMGLVVGEKARSYFRYRLTLYGILYCIDANDPSKRDIDAMAEHHSTLLPRIFGNWNRTKKVLGNDAYNLRVLARGIYMNNITFARPDVPLYELMMYLHIKYAKNFESISEFDLSEQISYWFYTFLLYSDPKKLTRILSRDVDLYKWYMSFFKEAKDFYAQRLHTIKNSSIEHSLG